MSLNHQCSRRAKQGPVRTSVMMALVYLLVCAGHPALAQSSPDQTIRSIAEVYSPDNQDRPRKSVPIDVTGIVNYIDAEWGMLFLGDKDSAIFVSTSEKNMFQLTDVRPGTHLRVVGQVDMDIQTVAPQKFEIIKQGEPLPPAVLDFSDYKPGDHWSCRVTATGVVQSVNIAQARAYLLVHDPLLDFTALINSSTDFQTAADLIGARVELTGTASYELDEATNQPGRLLIYVSDPADLRTIEPAESIAQPVALRTTTLDTLQQLLQKGMPVDDEIKLFCRIGHVHQDQFLVAENFQNSMPISTTATDLITAGDRVEVTGRIEQVNERFAFVPKIIQTLKAGTRFPARNVTVREILTEQIDQQRIAITGEIVNVSSNPETFTRTIRLKQDHTLFDAVFTEYEDDVFEDLQLDLANAQQLRIEGWLSVLPALESTDPRFKVTLDFSTDLSVATARPLVDRNRAVSIILGLIALTLLGLATAWLFRRQVKKKTGQLNSMTLQLNSTFESMREGILVLQNDGKVVQSNNRFFEILDIDPRTQPDSNILDQLTSRFEDPHRFNTLRASVKTNPNSVHRTQVVTVPPTPSRQLVIDTAPVFDAKDNVVARRWTFDDVTEKVQMEDQLRQAQKMEAVGRLASGVAHDFNNLLMIMSGSLDTLRIQRKTRVLSNDEEEQLLAAADSASKRGARLVKQLLGFSRQSALELQVVSLNPIALRMESMLRHSLGSNVKLSVQIADDLWNTKIDPFQIEQVLLNLCINARDALVGKTGQITVSTRNHVDSTGIEVVQLIVEDNGNGMSESVRKRIFEPLFTTKPGSKGAGLGLAMADGIIDQHEGNICCESEIGVGTRFEVSLPRSLETITVEPSVAHAVPTATNTGHVLVVDDEEAVRDTIEMMLGELGHTVTTAIDGADALEQLQPGHKVDVVLMDLTMPRVNGSDAFVEINRRFPGLPVVICTGHSCDPKTFRQQCGEFPNAILHKPVAIAELQTTIGEAIDQRPQAPGKTHSA